MYHDLNVSPPPLFTPSFMRADLWGVTLDYLPPIPGGGEGGAQYRLLTYISQRYPADVLSRALADYRARGYSHYWISIPDALPDLGADGYVAFARQIKAAGLIPCHFLRSKDYDGYNPNPAQVYPLCDRLEAEGLFTHAIHAWEASIFYSPSAYQQTFEGDCARYPSTLWGHHFQQGYAHFAQDKLPPQTFWEPSIAAGNHRLYYQYVSWPASEAWTGGMMAARTQDCTTRLVQGGLWGLSRTVEFVPFELVGMQLFNNLPDGDGRGADEDTANLKNLECLNAPGPAIFAGFGNGCRRKDGSPL